MAKTPKRAKISKNDSTMPYTLTKAGKRSLLAKPGASTLQNIEKLQQEGRRKHGKADITSKKYLELVNAARRWLVSHYGEFSEANTRGKGEQVASDMDSDDEDYLERGPDLLAPGLDEDGMGAVEEDSTFDDPEFKLAFENNPNRHSPKALALYLSYKVFHQHLSQQTADSNRAAFKWVWKYS